jgi:hypothetical protein
VYYFAETFDEVTYLSSGGGKIDGTITKQAGDSNVWEDRLWANHGNFDPPTEEIGTVRGGCSYLLDAAAGNESPGLCAWTLTIDGQGQLMIASAVDTMTWNKPQTMAVVGGTGHFFGSTGSLVITLSGGVFYSEVVLD